MWTAVKSYHINSFDELTGNTKETWKLINQVLMIYNTTKDVNKILSNGITITDSNKYFWKVKKKL